MALKDRLKGVRPARDTVLFLVALVGIGVEALFHHDSPSPQLLMLYSGMLGSIPLLRIRDNINKTPEPTSEP